MTEHTFSILTMRSAAADDRSTRARIRDAAIALFGRDGYERTSVRAVARAAGVSPALVIHHFGSKDGLRAECTRAIADEFLGRKDDLLKPDAAATMQQWLSDIEQFRPRLDYLARLLLEDSPAADELFDAILDATARMHREHVAAGAMRPGADPEATAIVLTLYGIAPIIAQRQLARALGEDALGTAGIRRLTVPILELFTHGLYTDDRFLAMARDALERTKGDAG